MVRKDVVDNATVHDAEIVNAEINVTALDTWDAVLNSGLQILDSIHVLGDGSTLIDKTQLEHAGEFIVLDWREVTDKLTGNTYMNVLVMNRQNQKARFNDGSTGIAAQLREYEEQYGKLPLHCQGVRRSDYLFIDDNGKQQSATTYYLK